VRGAGPVWALRHLVATHGAANIVFGTDHPANWPVGGIDQILQTPISDVEKIAILGVNMAKMLRLSS
jgi:predicted TIM-barrel fold metal-dependent hydrolase